MGILEKISEIEKEIARTQKNKATEYHLGLLKAKLAKYRAQLLEPSKSASSKGEGFDVMKSGDARVALIGFPSVGKSTFLSLMTSTASEAASYEFTTLTCIPGVIEYKGANIQLLDLPGIIEGAAQGKGRGRQVIAVARTADVVIMMLDATKGEVQRSLLEKELESVGIRLNKHKPNIYFKPKKGGGISFNSTVTLTQCSEKLVQLILHEYKIFNAEVLFREDCSPDEFIDVIVGNRVYMPCLYVYNKIDQISMEEVDRLARKPDSVVISCGMKLNLDYLLEVLWEYLALTCIYTKKRGQAALPPPHPGRDLGLSPYSRDAKSWGGWCWGALAGEAWRGRTSRTPSSSGKGPPWSTCATASTGHSPASSSTHWCGAPAPSTARSGWA
ncbi:developmentally-regulated GTP-binding protein 2 isoform X1 [Camelus bactrianus]|uniref:Developmentally-regulated GTP-binding protein 2 isoform X1 n=1 Tax=Camelus bactrianus TaxID=9837 RepID=A0AC58NJW9_CAMBA|nr:developmentally-regulated GTP-binding protein 2 isoform X1 [Camelus dromedarius]